MTTSGFSPSSSCSPDPKPADRTTGRPRSGPGRAAPRVRRAVVALGVLLTPALGLVGAPAPAALAQDPAPPSSVSITNVSKLEGNSGDTVFTFRVSGTCGDTDGSCGLEVQDLSGTADRTTDYGGFDSFGGVGATFDLTEDVLVHGDTAVEPDETFSLHATLRPKNFSGPTGGTPLAEGDGTGTIRNDDIAGPSPGPLTAASGGAQTAQPGKPFPAPLVAALADTAGKPLPGRTVAFTVTGGSASFPTGTTATATTDAQGRASSPTLTAGPTTGLVTVTASTPDATSSATFIETVQPPPSRAAGVRGSGQLTTLGGKRLTIAINVSSSATGSASGQVAVSGREITFGSRTVSLVTRQGPTATVTGTAVVAGGPLDAPFTLTVTDRPSGRDRLDLAVNGRTYTGTLTTGDITLS